jgi:hypothetical protein
MGVVVVVPVAALVVAGGERDGADDEVENEKECHQGEVSPDRHPPMC